MAPDPDDRHGSVSVDLSILLKGVALRLGLRVTTAFNLGGPGDFRVPDGGLPSDAPGVWHDSAVLVVEILSPDDATFDKLDFYPTHGVQELVVADWRDRSIRVFALQDGQVERDRSEVLGMTTSDVAAATDWPPTD